ncbi:glycosomal transporter (GAT2) putative (GAT2) [Leptomonas pyrrhocoris]|uniref:Glycosomal transporter (GAT2) putative (GAT2) n=1 Tax=Leptomonas pyrrhocoris TaxID=157538 RepID=A0A0N0VFI5_LEPPY|nr:glycosomal transporter (GAT2) putative (GAT2) [Leptomonas pyrrhocoris]KPA81144.1 glycosomal transporter (GAT2) putative (GAT2) [Leptomonas pyrrhocoris]|eukprot:XP_015659583.1 glycosomal transporter (GAT2) putative (GAT2) [Leptomonas pyrrhocoris]
MPVASKLASGRNLGFYAAQLLCAAAALRIMSDLIQRRKSGATPKRRSRHSSPSRTSGSDEGEEPIKLDRVFWRRFCSLLGLTFPRLVTFESGGAMLLVVLFYLRTQLTLLFAAAVGRNGRFLVEGKIKLFLFSVADIGLLAIPGTVLQIGVQYIKMMVQQRMRDNLQAALNKEYLQGNTVYMIATQSSIIDNPDHRMVQDANQFCKSVAHLFRALFKPILDVVTLSLELAKHGGFAAPGFLMSYYFLVATGMAVLLPNFAQLVAVSQQKEGNLRTKQYQLINHAEEIAFYNGEDIEREQTGRLLRSLIRHEYKIKRFKFMSGFSDNLLIKYGASLVGYLVCSLVAYDQRNLMSKGELTQMFLQNVQLYVPFSGALGRMLLIHKRVGALCGSVHRLGELREKLDRINAMNARNALANVRYAESVVAWSNIEIISPAGICIVRDFSLTVVPGKHTLIMGSNGSGKSSLLRVLSGLWLPAKGIVTIPSGTNALMCLPQRTYLPSGSLRALLTYPSAVEDAARESPETAFVSDEVIIDAAHSFGLGGMMEREGGLDASKNWEQVLSGGERQRVALVRVLLHRPLFAFLDECTSAISQDDEPYFYDLLQKAGVTVITVSHRETLRKLHRAVVLLDGEGGYSVSEAQ